MGVFFKISSKDLFDIRNKIFLTRGIQALNKNGFEKSLFSTSWFGRNNLKDFTYELCRLNEHFHLEIIEIHISRGDSWIKVFLNIFELQPKIESLEPLNGIDGLSFHLLPSSITNMRLRIDDIKGLYLFHVLFGKEHKIGCYYSKSGFDKKIEELSKLIESDLSNIDHFVKRWYELQKPLITNWKGEKIGYNAPLG